MKKPRLKPRLKTLVKYNWGKQKEKDLVEKPFEKDVFFLLNKIKNMKGHVLVINIITGKPLIFHRENLIELENNDLYETIEIKNKK